MIVQEYHHRAVQHEGAGGQPASGPGFVRGRHFTEYVARVKELRRRQDDEAAERLLLELVEATELEARAEGRGVAPWYYEQLAILYRKAGDLEREVAILERYARQEHAPGVMPSRLLQRLRKARIRLEKART